MPFFADAIKLMFCAMSLLAARPSMAQDLQKDAVKTVRKTDTGRMHRFEKGSVIATLSLGFVDMQRKAYSVPSGFEIENIVGFAPLYGRLEYGVGNKVSLGVAFVYSGYNAGYSMLFDVNGQTYRRHNNDVVKLFSGSLFAAYHLGDLVKIKHLDPFVAAGVGINTISHNHKPQGDSAMNVKEYTKSPFLRAGARYYLSRRGSIFGDIGFDDKTILTLGFSCNLEK